MASSFDTMGVITRSVRDAEFVWSHMIGLDPMDATSLNETWDSGSIAWSKTDLKGVKIGIPKEYFID